MRRASWCSGCWTAGISASRNSRGSVQCCEKRQTEAVDGTLGDPSPRLLYRLPPDDDRRRVATGSATGVQRAGASTCELSTPPAYRPPALRQHALPAAGRTLAWWRHALPRARPGVVGAL